MFGANLLQDLVCLGTPSQNIYHFILFDPLPCYSLVLFVARVSLAGFCTLVVPDGLISLCAGGQEVASSGSGQALGIKLLR